MPDIVGYEFERALHILNKYDFKIIIKETFGKENIKTNEARIIRQKIYKNNILQLVIAYF